MNTDKKMKKGTISKLARKYLGEPCQHPYHSLKDCSYLALEPSSVRRFANWADRQLKIKSKSLQEKI